MKSSTLLRSIILIPLFLSCAISHAAEEFERNKSNTPKQRRYFHPQNPVGQHNITGTTHNTSSEEESFLSSTTNSTEDNSFDDPATEETLYAGPRKKRSRLKDLKRSVSLDSGSKKISRVLSKKTNHKDTEEKNTGSEKQILRSFSKKTKHTDTPTDIGEQNLGLEKHIAFLSPIEAPVDNPKDPVPEHPQTTKIQRQRSWGKDPHIITKQPPSINVEGFPPKTQLPPDFPYADETTPIIPQISLGQVTHKLPIEENVSRKKQKQRRRLSHDRPLQRSPSTTLHRSNPEGRDGGLSPRGHLSPRPWGVLPQERNPLQEGLSLYLKKDGQPLGHQPTSPRYQPTSPRLNHSAEKETTIDLARFSESGELPQDFFLEDQESSNSYSLKQDQPLLAVKYEKDRGNAPFIRIMDNRLFRPDPRVIVGFGVAGSLVFTILPPTAMTGINVNVTGYYFDIPPGEWLSTTLVTTFMTTFTLALLKEGYEWGQTLGWPIWNAIKACYSRCTGTKEQEDALSMPLFEDAEYTWKIGYKKNLLYWGTNGFSLLAALPEGILPTALLSLVWAKHYSHLIIPAGICLLIRYTGKAYNENTRIVRYLSRDYLNQEPDGEFVYMANNHRSDELENSFYQQNLDPKQAIKHKNLVREAIQRSLQIGEENDDIATEKYKIIDHERDIIKGHSIDNKKYFALSVLMSKPTVDAPTKTKNPSAVSYLKNQCQKGAPFIKKPYEFLKIPLKALALVGAGMAIDQGVTIFMRYWLPNSSPYLIDGSTGILITFYTVKELLHLAKAVKEYDSPKASLATVPNFSLASFGATVPAGFSALVGVILGFLYVDESESSQKLKGLMAAYALDSFLSGHSHFKGKLQGFLTAAVTTIPEYTKECVVEYTPQLIKKGATFLKEGIVNNTPECLKEFMSDTYNFFSKYTSLPYYRSWLWKWHHDWDEEVNDGNDAVTNASSYFITQKSQSTDIYYDESSTYGEDAYGENIDYYFNEHSS